MSLAGFQRRRRELKAKQELEKEKDIILSDMKVVELKEIAKDKKIEGYSNMKKDDLIAAITAIEEDNQTEGD